MCAPLASDSQEMGWQKSTTASFEQTRFGTEWTSAPASELHPKPLGHCCLVGFIVVVLFSVCLLFSEAEFML